MTADLGERAVDRWLDVNPVLRACVV